MSEEAFLRLVGPELCHVTPWRNLQGIREHGLLRPVRLAEEAEVDPATLLLRNGPYDLRIDSRWRARLTTQAPLLAGEGQEFLDPGISLRDWAARMDARLFLWPDSRGDGFRSSHDEPTATIRLSAEALYRMHAARMDLSPINSGSALRKPAPRGDWIWVPATEADRFAEARKVRGLVKAADKVAEVSLRADLTPAALSFVLAAPLPDRPDDPVEAAE